MGAAGQFKSEKLILGILISQVDLAENLLDTLVTHFGPVDYISPTLDFTFTAYYDGEMGRPISRIILSFARLVKPDTLASIKLVTNSIESLYMVAGKRRINLDPGILNLSHLILATTKDGSHRIPLRRGIFAEITLLYEKKTFRPLDWTYPDYRSPEYQAILQEIRTIYKAQLQAKT